MRPVLLILGTLGLILVGAGAAGITGQEPQGDPGGISTAALSRCAGIAGMELRSADAAFGELMLDGAPWLSTQEDQQALVVTSTGTLRRRNGTSVPFRFVCALDDKRHASMLRIVSVGADASLAPSRSIKGMVVPAGRKTPLLHGSELRIQLFDISVNPRGELLAEQVVRSGWAVPIPFDLRVPVDAIHEGSKLAITARIVLSRAEIYRMASPRILTPDEARRPVMLDLAP